MNSSAIAMRFRLESTVRHPLYRLAAWSSLVVLTVLLVIPDPYAAAPGLDELQQFTPTGYIVHLTAYLLVTLACLSAHGLGWSATYRPWLVGLCAHAWVTEFIQGFVPGRTVDVWDGIANLVGIATAVTLLIMAGRRTGH